MFFRFLCLQIARDRQRVLLQVRRLVDRFRIKSAVSILLVNTQVIRVFFYRRQKNVEVLSINWHEFRRVVAGDELVG